MKAKQNLHDWCLENNKQNLLNEWDKFKNGNLTPYNVAAHSNRKITWKCEKGGHEWEATIYSRTMGCNCPFCAGQKAIKGVNDLETLNPTLAKEWHHTKNHGLSPADVMPGSHVFAWWECSICTHEWQAFVYSRNVGNGCPKCKMSRKTSYAEQAIYYYLWLSNKNIKNRFMFKNKYEIDIYIPSIPKAIAIEYRGVYYHKNRKIKDLKKDNILNSKNDELQYFIIEEVEKKQINNIIIDNNKIFYHFTTNYSNFDDLIKAVFKLINYPINIDINSNRDRIIILERYKDECINNSIKTTHPQITAEWNFKKNGKLLPEMFSAGSHVNVWWMCIKGHEWKSMISNRTSGKGCPICSNKKILKGYNDLAFTHPHIAAQWHPTKNGNLTPHDVTAGSAKKAWWLCEKKHECWRQFIAEKKMVALYARIEQC